MIRPTFSTAKLLPVPDSDTTVRQQVVDALREAISEGQLPPGARLVERELCEAMGVSRTCLREALRDLESDGIVTSTRNRGVEVSRIGIRDAREIYEMREMLEALLAKRFAKLASSSQIQELEASVDRLEKAYAQRAGLVKAKRDFYEALLAGAHHDLAAKMLRSIQLRASQLRLMTLSDDDRSQQSITEIRRVVHAIKNRNEDEACEAARQHVRNAGTLALRLLETSPVTAERIR